MTFLQQSDGRILKAAAPLQEMHRKRERLRRFDTSIDIFAWRDLPLFLFQRARQLKLLCRPGNLHLATVKHVSMPKLTKRYISIFIRSASQYISCLITLQFSINIFQ